MNYRRNSDDETAQAGMSHTRDQTRQRRMLWFPDIAATVAARQAFMSVAADIERARWTIAECHHISFAAYERWIDVEPHVVLRHLETWRSWYYRLVPTTVVLAFDDVRVVRVSGR